ncbi:MAG: TonB-dependent receptor [Acidobacteria bacterium]|nr:TonB-dependent receptor [Acidobacteriota bacterium]
MTQLREQVTVTADPGAAESVESISRSVNVINREKIRERAEAVLAQVAAEETGIHLQRTSPAIGGVYVRGLTGNKVNVFVDGVRYSTSAQRGGINTFLNLVDPSHIQAVEVLRGPDSAQYGSDAVGGSIQLLSRSPAPAGVDGKIRGSLDTHFNSADMSLGSSLVSGFSARDFGVQVSFAGRRASTLRPGKAVDSHSAVTRFLGLPSALVTDGRLPDTAFTQYGGMVRMNWTPTEISRLTAFYTRSQLDGGKRYDQLLGGDGNLVADLRNLMLDLAYLRYERSRLGALDQFSATYSFNSQREERVNQGGNGNPLAAIQHEYERTTAHGLQAQARKRWSRQHDISFGGEGYFEGIRSPSFAVDPLTSVSSIRRGRIPDRARYRGGGAYLQGVIEPIADRLRATASVRLSGASYRARAPDSPAVKGSLLWPDDSLSVWDVTFRAGAVWSLSRGLNLFANASRGFRAPHMTDLGTLGLTGSGYEVAARDVEGMGATIGSSAGAGAVSTGRPVVQVEPETSISYELGLRSWRRSFDTDLSVFLNNVRGSIEKQALILPPGAVGKTLGDQQISAQDPSGVVYVPAATNPVLVRANYGDAQVWGIEHTFDGRLGQNVTLSTVFTCLRARDPRTGLPPNIEGGTPPPNGYLRIRYSRWNARFWLEPYLHAAARQERLSSLDLEDRRTGAMRSRTSIRRFFQNGATVRGLVGPGLDGRLGTADDLLLATGETLPQIQDRVLGPGVNSAPLFPAVPGYVTLNVRAGIRLGEDQDCLIALTNIGDRNYRGVSWGLDAPGRSLFIRYRFRF